MVALKFVDSYNMVVYLERPTDSDDFTEIIDFWNENPIRIRKDFSRKVTPLFETMLIQHQSEEGDSLERAATTGSSLEAKQVSGNITKTRSKATLNEPTHQGTGLGSGPRRQYTMGDTIARTSESVHNNLPEQIRNAQVEVCKEENIGDEGFRGEGEPFEVRSD
ncbi:hypothetical protein Tco_0982898, partial [Tanacetum coccineum]